MTNPTPSTERPPDSVVLQIGPRRLLPPAGASEVLRDSIANTPQPDPTMGPLIPEDKAALEAVVAQADAETIDFVRLLREQFPVSVDEDMIEGVGVYHVTPAEVDPRHDDHLFVYVHGGAFVLNAGEAGIAEPIIIAHRTGIRVLSIDYRMPPDHPAPAGIHDVMAVYRSVIAERPASSVALGGSSGGANISMVTVQHAIRDGVDVPGALYIGTPGADMTETGDSWYINNGIDRVLPSYADAVNAIRFYAGGRDLADPLISPIYGSFEGFPPTFLVTGTRDLLLSATVRTHAKIRRASSIADLLVFEGASHGDYAKEFSSPESQLAYAELNSFLLQHLK